MQLPYYLAVSFLGSKPTVMKAYVHAKLYAWKFTALFIITHEWKQCKCLPADGWINKMWCVYTMKYSSAVQRK